MTASSAVILLAAVAGGLLAVAVREAVLATPALAGWVRRALEPLGRAGSEGYAPTALERRRLAMVGAAALLVLGVLVLGSAGAALLALAGPAAAAVWCAGAARATYAPSTAPWVASRLGRRCARRRPLAARGACRG